MQQGWYQPRFKSDIWSLGQLRLYITEAKIPDAQHQLLSNELYLDEVKSGYCSQPQYLRQQRAHLQYLQGCLSSRIVYAKQVQLTFAMMPLSKLLQHSLYTVPAKVLCVSKIHKRSCCIFQVKFPHWMSGPAGTPEAELKEVIKSCLCSKPQFRLSAS